MGYTRHRQKGIDTQAGQASKQAGDVQAAQYCKRQRLLSKHMCRVVMWKHIHRSRMVDTLAIVILSVAQTSQNCWSSAHLTNTYTPEAILIDHQRTGKPPVMIVIRRNCCKID
jgi:hypothetical protein